MESAEIYHHGIKGQKWGTRNGPPYPLDSSDHSAAEKKAAGGGSSGGQSSKKKKLNLPKANILKKRSKSSHRELTDEEKETLKKVAVGAGVGLAAGAAVAGGIYLYRKNGARYVSNIIRKGTTIQTLSANPDRIAEGKHIYTNTKLSDKIIYEGEFGRLGKNDYKSRIQGNIVKDVKVADKHVGKREFDKLYKSDPEFRKSYHELTNSVRNNPENKKYRFKNKYDAFNSTVIPLEDNMSSDNGKKVRPMLDKYYDNLSKKGYGALEDAKGNRYSHKLRTDRAAIIFDKDAIDMNNLRVDKLDERTVKNGHAFASTKIPQNFWQSSIREAADDYSKHTAAHVALSGASGAGGVIAANEIEKRKKNNGR